MTDMTSLADILLEKDSDTQGPLDSAKYLEFKVYQYQGPGKGESKPIGTFHTDFDQTDKVERAKWIKAVTPKSEETNYTIGMSRGTNEPKGTYVNPEEIRKVARYVTQAAKDFNNDRRGTDKFDPRVPSKVFVGEELGNGPSSEEDEDY